jgi:signal transduction histidine kinase
MLDLPAPGRIFGAVEIDTGHERTVATAMSAGFGEWLEIQPGRDRLLDNRALHQLRDLVRFALDYYANRYKLREAQRIEQLRDQEPATTKQKRALDVLQQNKETMPAAVYQDVRREVSAALEASKTHEETLDRRAALLAPLASAGMAALSMNHEMSREVRVLTRAVSTLRRVAIEIAHPELNDIADEFEEVASRIGALQELFAPLLTDMDQAAVTRLRAKPIVRQTVAAMSSLMPSVSFDTSGIPDDLALPIGSNAEWNALFQNVLANAWNAMLTSADRRVRISGGRNGRQEWLRVSDTGIGLGVPIEAAAKYFEPFERGLSIDEQRRSIALGGQGLGLAIVRMIARRRSAETHFVKEEVGFSTTFELAWRG